MLAAHSTRAHIFPWIVGVRGWQRHWDNTTKSSILIRTRPKPKATVSVYLALSL